MYSLLAIIAIVVILFFTIYLLIVFDKRKSRAFTNGTWIDRDGNLLVMKLNKNKILLSFGVNTTGDEYELTEKQYSFKCSKFPFSSKYNIKVSNGIKISIGMIDGIAMVYDGDKKIGKFAKNNLIAFD